MCNFVKVIGRKNRQLPAPEPVSGGIVGLETPFMRTRVFVALALAAAVSAGCGAARFERTLSVPTPADGSRDQAKAHVDFGIAVAKNNLWRDATAQWEKAVKLDPSYAAAWNNLGIGLEQLGKFKEAREAYEEALKLDPDNTFIRNNYDQFREIYDRQNRRRER